MAITTTVDNSGSSTIITTSITSRVIMFASSGSPAVTATSCILATSLTTRCTVSALRLREWNCWERRCTWLNTRLRNDVAAREPTSEKGHRCQVIREGARTHNGQQRDPTGQQQCRSGR